MGLFLLSTSINDLDDGGECALAKFADWEVSNDKVLCLAGLQNKWDPAKITCLGLQYQQDTSGEVLGACEREVLAKGCKIPGVFMLDQRA